MILPFSPLLPENPGKKRNTTGCLLPGGLQRYKVAPTSKQLNEEDPCPPLRTGSVGERDKQVDFLPSPLFT